MITYLYLGEHGRPMFAQKKWQKDQDEFQLCAFQFQFKCLKLFRKYLMLWTMKIKGIKVF